MYLIHWLVPSSLSSALYARSCPSFELILSHTITWYDISRQSLRRSVIKWRQPCTEAHMASSIHQTSLPPAPSPPSSEIFSSSPCDASRPSSAISSSSSSERTPSPKAWRLTTAKSLWPHTSRRTTCTLRFQSAVLWWAKNRFFIRFWTRPPMVQRGVWARSAK
eukprot:COSAG05_NODE_4822_length_1358_cov_40.370929_3_plen_164_part_00